MAAITLLTGSWLWIHLSASEIYTGANILLDIPRSRKQNFSIQAM